MHNNDLSSLLQAVQFAADKHAGQRRKDQRATPYINHPIGVATLLADVGKVTDVSLLIAAMLHDTVEDTDTSLAELRSVFGEVVANLVAEVTDDKRLPGEQRKHLQVTQTPGKSDLAKQLKIADKIANVRDIEEQSPVGWESSRKFRYLEWAAHVVAGCRGTNPTLEALFDEVLMAAKDRVQPTLS